MSSPRDPSRTPAPTDEGPVRDQVSFDSTIDVLERARTGDHAAARELIERALMPLRRWARGRLPGYARADANTDDIVQDAVVHTLRRIELFQHRTVAGLQAYLRESVLNRIRDEIRRVTRRGIPEEVPVEISDDAPSPLEELILREQSQRYLDALRSLRPDDRLAIIHRLEQRHSFAELARILGKPTEDAARMAATRALKRLARAMGLRDPA